MNRERITRSDIEDKLGFKLDDDPVRRKSQLEQHLITWEQRGDVYANLATGRLKEGEKVMAEAKEKLTEMAASHHFYQEPSFLAIKAGFDMALEIAAYAANNAVVYRMHIAARDEVVDELQMEIAKGYGQETSGAEDEYISILREHPGLRAGEVAKARGTSIKVAFVGLEKLMEKKMVFMKEDSNRAKRYYLPLTEGKDEEKEEPDAD